MFLRGKKMQKHDNALRRPNVRRRLDPLQMRPAQCSAQEKES